MFSTIRRLTRNKILSIGHLETSQRGLNSDGKPITIYATTTAEKAEILSNRFAQPPQPPEDETSQHQQHCQLIVVVIVIRLTVLTSFVKSGIDWRLCWRWILDKILKGFSLFAKPANITLKFNIPTLT